MRGSRTLHGKISRGTSLGNLRVRAGLQHGYGVALPDLPALNDPGTNAAATF